MDSDKQTTAKVNSAINNIESELRHGSSSINRRIHFIRFGDDCIPALNEAENTIRERFNNYDISIIHNIAICTVDISVTRKNL